MQVAKARYRAEARRERFEGLKGFMGSAAKVCLVLSVIALVIVGMAAFINAASQNQEVPPPAELTPEEVAAQDQYITQSREAGAIWAQDFKATYQACDARVGTEALALEGFDQKAWLEGCLTTAKTLTQPEG